VAKRGPKKFDIVEIVWLDCVGYNEKSWRSDDERLGQEESRHRTIGYFLEDDGKLTHVCRTYRPLNGSYEGMLAIPSGASRA
jgi:hypothetical protein